MCLNSSPNKQTGSWRLEVIFLFILDYRHHFFFHLPFLFCWLIRDKWDAALPSLTAPLFPLYSFLCISLPPCQSACFLPPSLHSLPLSHHIPCPLSPYSFPLLSLCNPNVLYVVIKQCQTQKLFINNIKWRVSSNGWGGLCLFASLLLV